MKKSSVQAAYMQKNILIVVHSELHSIDWLSYFVKQAVTIDIEPTTQ